MSLFNKKELKKIEELEQIINTKNEEIINLNDLNRGLNIEIEKKSAELEISKKNLSKYFEITNIENEKIKIKAEYDLINFDNNALKIRYTENLKIYQQLKEQINLYNNDLEIIDAGVYEPIFNFEHSDEYKMKIKENNKLQKELIKENQAITSGADEIYYNAKYPFLTTSYKKKISNYKKLILLAFNSECDSLILQANWNNFNHIKLMITDVFGRINQNSAEFCGFLLLQNSIINGSKTEDYETSIKNHMILITKEFLNLKHQELSLVYESKLKKQEEKEELLRIKELMREEEKARRDFEKAEREAEEEEIKVRKEISKIKTNIELQPNNFDDLTKKIRELEERLKLVLERKERAISMAQQTRQGFIYVISNIGSFGQNIFKIGMTRRLDPRDRVRELGDASVPFRFDIHTLIFSEDAPALENALHKAFSSRKLNWVNSRKEFFHVSLDEIKEKINELNLDAEFISIPEAMEFRETIALKEKNESNKAKLKIKNDFDLPNELLN